MDNQTRIDLLITGLSLFSDPGKEFCARYEFGTMYSFYRNYLEYACVFLYEDAFFEEFINDHAKNLGVRNAIIGKLKKLNAILSKFYDDCRELGDFDLIRRDEWNEIIPLAKACLEELPSPDLGLQNSSTTK